MAVHNAPSLQGKGSLVSRDALGLFLGFIGVVIFSGTLPATRLAVASLSPGFVTVGRAAVAGLLALTVLWACRRPVPKGNECGLLIASSLLLAFGFPLFLGFALQVADASHGAIVLAILPLATAVAATIFVGERPSGLFWFYAALGAITVGAFVIWRSGGSFEISDGLFLIAAACSSCGYALSGILPRSRPGWEVICWQLVTMLPITIPATLWIGAGINFSQVTAWSWAGFAYVSVFSMFIGFFAWNAGLAIGGVARVGQVQLLQVFITLAMAAPLLGEAVSPITLLFAVAIAAIVAAAQRARVTRRPVAAAGKQEL